MRPLWYILDKDKNPIPAKDMVQASRLLADTESRRIASDVVIVEDFTITITVSTVFLVLDHNHSPNGKPVLFESMIFNGELNQFLHRYCTWQEAEEGHKKMVELVKSNLWVNRILDQISVDAHNTKAITNKIVDGLKLELYSN